MLGNGFAGEWEPVKFESLHKNICILFLYIFGVDEVGDIMYKYITERFMNEFKESFRKKCC